MHRRGFSVVELIVVVTVMAVLLVLGVVNLRGSQANSRDVERSTDVKNIAQHLESYFTAGTGVVTGSYPSTDLIGKETTYLQDLDVDNLKAPDQSDSTLVAAADANNPPSSPALTIDNYIYQPLRYDGANWQLCTQTTDECTKFNLFYKTEKDVQGCTAGTACVVKSRNQ